MIRSFGLERLGMLSLRAPWVMLGVVLLVTGLMIAGAMRIGVSSSIRDVFRTDSPSFALFEDMSRQYPGRESDVLLLVEGPGLLSPERLDLLNTLSLELTSIDGVANVLSILKAQRAQATKDAPPDFLVPEVPDAGLDSAALLRELNDHPLTAGKLISRDGDATLLVIALQPEREALTELRRIRSDIADVARQSLAGSGLTAELTGIPVVRLIILDVLGSDQLKFRFTSYAIALALAWAFFRDPRYLLLAILPSVVATVWLLGGMGWTGQAITPVTNVVPTLVMVITFSNAVHLLLALRRNRAAGRGRNRAIRDAVATVGPASVLTSLTTAIALLALTLARQPTIDKFALTAAYGTALAFIAVLAIVPGLARLILPREATAAERDAGRLVPRLINRLCEGAASLTARHAPKIAFLGVFLVLAGGLLYSRNEAHFLYLDHLPRHTEALHAVERIDERLSGTSALRLFLRWPPGHDMLSDATLDAIRAAHEALAGEPMIREVWSLYSIEQWIHGAGRSRADLLQDLRTAPSPLSKRLFLPEQRSALVTGQMPDTDAALMLPLIDRLESRLDSVRVRYPGVEFAVTGIAAQSSRAAIEIIGNLSRALIAAIVVIIVLMGLLLRSPGAALIAVLPNLLPLAVAGGYLFLSGRGLQLNSIIALTVGFGIAVDSTIHMINHYQRTLALEPDWQRALEKTVLAIGPALVVATLALMAGGVTMLSPMPMSQLYGFLSMLVLLTALIGDLLFLPALIHLVEATKRGPRTVEASRT